MAQWKNPFRETKPMTVGLFLLTSLWALFQWRDPTPPPVLDQMLVAAMGVWFANEAIDKRTSKGRRSISIDKDGNVKVSEADDDDKADDDEATDPKQIEGSG